MSLSHKALARSLGLLRSQENRPAERECPSTQEESSNRLAMSKKRSNKSRRCPKKIIYKVQQRWCSTKTLSKEFRKKQEQKATKHCPRAAWKGAHGQPHLRCLPRRARLFGASNELPTQRGVQRATSRTGPTSPPFYWGFTADQPKDRLMNWGSAYQLGS